MGQDLALLSVGELAERIALLKDEIARLEAEMKQKERVQIGGGHVFQEISFGNLVNGRRLPYFKPNKFG